MAYTVMRFGTEEGPYPNKEGEFCGNYHPDFEPHPIRDETLEQARTNHRNWLAKMRFGKVHPCKAGNTEEMERQGYVGLYLKADQPLMGDEIEVPTPEELKEPK